MGRKIVLPVLMAVAGATVLFVSIEPRQGRATYDADPTEPATLLGTLEGRDESLRIEVTQDGLRYTVVDRHGVVLAERLSPSELSERFAHLSPSGLHADGPDPVHGPLMVVPDDGVR